MAGINSIYDISQKKGKEFVDSLFNRHVIISEQLNGTSLSFEIVEDNSIVFYKRNGQVINNIDRILSKYYMDAITYIESIHSQLILPIHWKFGLEYFPNTQPVFIAYDRLPKNKLVLSYIHDRDERGNIIRELSIPELNEWANILDIERPPIFFDGVLNKRQKTKILDFVYHNDPDTLIKNFGTASLTRYILSILQPTRTTSLLQNNPDKPIESIIFRFIDSNSDSIIGRIVDPLFSTYKKKEDILTDSTNPSDMFYVTLLDITEFFYKINLDKIKVVGNTEDDRYLSFIMTAFTMFCDMYPGRYSGVDFQLPKFMRRSEFQLNRELITDEKTLEWIDRDSSYEELFKIFLAAFRKRRQKEVSFLTTDILMMFNDIVSKIQRKIKIDKSLKESTESKEPIEFGSIESVSFFDDLMIYEEEDSSPTEITTTNKTKQNKTQSKEKQEYISLDDDEIDTSNITKNKKPTTHNKTISKQKTKPSPLRLATFWKQLDDHLDDIEYRRTRRYSELSDDELDSIGLVRKPKSEKTKKESVVVYIDLFQTINKRHIEDIKRLWEDNKKHKIVLVDVNSSVRIDAFPIYKSTLNSMFEIVFTEYSKYIAGFVRSEFPLLENILSSIDEAFDICKIIVPERFYLGYQKQMEWYNKIHCKSYIIDTIANNTFSKNVFDAIRSRDFGMYKYYMPDILLTFYDILCGEVSEINHNQNDR